MLTIIVIVVLYQLISIAAISYSGVGEGQYRLGNLASPIMRRLAFLMSRAVLGSPEASLQSTFISPARTMLAMGCYGALPKKFSHISPKFQSPGYATIVSAVVASVFYAVMRVVSEAVLWDTITVPSIMYDALLLRSHCLRLRLVLPTHCLHPSA